MAGEPKDRTPASGPRAVDARAERLAAALRANLGRRKAQAQEKAKEKARAEAAGPSDRAAKAGEPQ